MTGVTFDHVVIPCLAIQRGQAEWPCALPVEHDGQHDDWNGRRWGSHCCGSCNDRCEWPSELCCAECEQLP